MNLVDVNGRWEGQCSVDERLTVDNQCLAGLLSLSVSDTGSSAQIDWTDWTDKANDHTTGFHERKGLKGSFITSGVT